MYIKFLQNKKGGSTKAIDYLLNKRVDDGTAKILKGNEQLTRKIIQSITKKQKVTVGVLSFEESNLTQNQKEVLMQDFEKILLPGLNENQYNILWVEHRDKGRLEMNFVIPKMELTTQKALQPYYHKQDFARIDMFEDKYNILYNLSSKKDPAKKQTLENDNKIELIKDYKKLDEKLHSLVQQGKMNNREQIIQTLQSIDIEVTRVGKDYISVKMPEAKKARRLKGGIYNEQFTSLRNIRKISDRTREEIEQFHSRDTSRELEQINKRLEQYTQQKSRANEKLFSRGSEKKYRLESSRTINEHEFNSRINDRSISNEYGQSESDDQRENYFQGKPLVSTSINADGGQRREVYIHQGQQKESGKWSLGSNEQTECTLYKNQGLEDDIARRTLERIRAEQEQRKRAYEQARRARIELHKATTGQSKELREQSKTDNHELREKYADIIKQSEPTIRTAQQHYARISEDTKSLSWIERFKEQFNEFRTKFANALENTREYLKSKFNEHVRAYDALDYKLQKTSNLLDSNSNENKKELTYKDVEEVKNSVNESIDYNDKKVEEYHQQEGSHSHSYGMSM